MPKLLHRCKGKEQWHTPLHKEEPLPQCDVKSLASCPRLLGHARRFSKRSPDARAAIVKRYWRFAASWPPAVLQRYTVHVAAWIALVATDVFRQAQSSNISPPALLIKLLRLRPRRSKLRPWLSAALEFVRRRLPALEEEFACDAELWAQLRACLPSAGVDSTVVADVLPVVVDHSSPCKPSTSPERAVADAHRCPLATAHAGAQAPASALGPAERRAERLQRQLARWRLRPWAAQQERLDALEQQLATLEEAPEPQTLRSLLREAVAALAPPRTSGQELGSGDTMTEEARRSLCTAAEIQARVRQLLIRALPLWLDRWDDEQIRPCLDRIVAMVSQLQVVAQRGGSPMSVNHWAALQEIVQPQLKWLIAPQSRDAAGHTSKSISWAASSAASGDKKIEDNSRGRGSKRHWSDEEWQHLVALVRREVASKEGSKGLARLGLSRWAEIAVELGNGRTTHSVRAFYRLKTDPDYAKPTRPDSAKHERGLIRAIATAAMLKLGGTATVVDILECCRSDPAIIEEFHSKLNSHMSKVRGTKRELPVWEATLQTNIGKHFQKTGFRRNGYAVYALQGVGLT